MKIESIRSGGEHILVLDGELDIATAPALGLAIARCVADGARTVLVDLSRLVFLDSTGLHVLLEAHFRYPDQLRLVPGPPRVQRIFEIIGTAPELSFVPSADGRASRLVG